VPAGDDADDADAADAADLTASPDNAVTPTSTPRTKLIAERKRAVLGTKRRLTSGPPIA
jgi:hypothetical protein